MLGGVRRAALSHAHVLKNVSVETPEIRRVDLGHEMADKAGREKVK
jgi:hypothetical protein